MTSVSLEPLLLLVCFDNSSRTLPAVREARRFAVNVLREGQDELARVFASKRVAREKFESVTHIVAHGVPVIDGALAWLACDLRELLPAGDHTIGIGEVTQMDAEPDGRAAGLVRGRLHRLAPGLAGAEHAQRQERDHERGDRHHAGLAAHDRPHDRQLLLLGERADGLRVLELALVEDVCAEASRSCSAMIETTIGSSR